MDYLSRIAFAIISVALVALAAGLTLFGVYQVVVAVTSPADQIGRLLLGAVDELVIAVAIFDVAKYLLEEEVIRGREMRQASEARRSLTKFISTITIAVFLAGLVSVFEVAQKDVSLMIYPTFLLLTGVALIVGLGIFQRLNASVEQEIDDDEDEEEAEAEETAKAKS